jgi:hypothetical protein
MGVISHPEEVQHCYERVLAGSTVRRRYVEGGTGQRFHGCGQMPWLGQPDQAAALVAAFVLAKERSER